MRPLARFALVAAAAWFGFLAGFIAAVAHRSSHPPDERTSAEYTPLPHHVPKYRGGVALRFAMVHDIIHERFPKHGPAHYRERDRLTRDKLAALPPGDPAALPLMDDLAVGLERLGRPEDAVPVMRDKLARQEAKGLSGRDLYTTYANLGTFLIHAHFRKAIAGDEEAGERFEEGVGFIRRSVDVNPEAHFGREQWQLAIAEFILAATEQPELLKEFDCLGNRLDLDIEPILKRGGSEDRRYGRPYTFGEPYGWAHELARGGGPVDDPARWGELQQVRGAVTPVGAEKGWDDVDVPAHRKPVAFDEPVLGIIGMWRQGGGANPHFCLALGETMLRVGQRYVAWAAFERAHRLADRYWPDPGTQQFLRDHCRKRQAQIEETLSDSGVPWQRVSPPPGADVVAGLREQFDAELARGEAYQQAYQEYEGRKIAAGVPISDEHFFDEFHAGREPIASPSGPEEWYARRSSAGSSNEAVERALAWGVFGAGVAGMCAALALRWAGRRRAMPRAA